MGDPGPCARAARGGAAGAGLALLGAAALAAPSTELDSSDVPAGGSDDASVICPAGTNALGGGVDLGNVNFMRTTESQPVLSAGFLDAIPAGTYRAPPFGWIGAASASASLSGPRALRVGAVCADVAVETVVTKETVASLAIEGSTSACASGDAISGGAGVGNISAMPLRGSAPTFGPGGSTPLTELEAGTHGAPTGWRALVGNEDDEPRELGVAAVCTEALEVSTEVATTSASPATAEDVRVLCPAGHYAVSGGIEPLTRSDVGITQLTPLLPGDPPKRMVGLPDGSYGAPVGWEGTLYNGSTTASRAFSVAAVCVPEPSGAAGAGAALAALAGLAARRRRAAGGSRARAAARP